MKQEVSGVSANSSHTPGPWIAVLRPGGITIQTEPIDLRRSGIAEVRLWPGEEIAEANARLIAAAPELLDLAKLAAAHLEELRDAWERGAISEHDGKGGTRSNRNCELVTSLLACVAKAEGRR